MKTNLYWIESGTCGRLATMARPRAGDWLEDEVRNLKTAGIHTVVSLLEDSEVAELGLEHERTTCEAAGLAFRSFPIGDRDVPAPDQHTRDFIRALRDELLPGRSIAIHCRIGIGRASVMAAAVLRLLGVTAEDALARIAAARGLPVPDTEEQRAWVGSFGDGR